MKIQELKQYQITDYLQGLGFEPVKSVGNSLVYYSPKRTEKTPSFYVTPSRNVWTDYGNGSRGDIIDLIKYLYDFDCTTACKHLENIVNGLAYSLPKNSFSSFGNEVSLRLKLQLPCGLGNWKKGNLMGRNSPPNRNECLFF